MPTPQEILQLSHTVAYKSDFLEFFYENPFQDAYMWQITWNQHKAICYKNTYLKNRLVPIIRQEEGEIGLDVLLPIVQKIRTLTLPAQLYCRSMGRDGHHYKLILGDSFTHLAYQWYEIAVPDAWEALNEIAHELQTLLSAWAGKVQGNLRFTHSEEETEKATVTFMEWTKVD